MVNGAWCFFANCTLSGSPDAITALNYSPKGGLLAIGARDGSIRMWQLARPAK